MLVYCHVLVHNAVAINKSFNNTGTVQANGYPIMALTTYEVTLRRSAYLSLAYMHKYTNGLIRSFRYILYKLYTAMPSYYFPYNIMPVVSHLVGVKFSESYNVNIEV